MRYINSSVDGPSKRPIPHRQSFLSLLKIPLVDHVLRSINVESSFRTPDSTSFVKVEPLPDLVPRVSNPSFWPVGDDGTQLELSFGKYEPGNVVGVYSQRKIPSQNLKWGYDTESKTWTEQETKQGWVSPENVDDSVRVASNQNVWVPGRKKGYQLSGLAFNETSTRVDGLWDTSGLVVYDQESNTWANETIPFDAHTGGGMVHISTANDDVLIHFGGWGVDNLIPVCHCPNLEASIRERFLTIKAAIYGGYLYIQHKTIRVVYPQYTLNKTSPASSCRLLFICRQRTRRL